MTCYGCVWTLPACVLSPAARPPDRPGHVERYGGRVTWFGLMVDGNLAAMWLNSMGVTDQRVPMTLSEGMGVRP
jgi:hypothetical protein